MSLLKQTLNDVELLLCTTWRRGEGNVPPFDMSRTHNTSIVTMCSKTVDISTWGEKEGAYIKTQFTEQFSVNYGESSVLLMSFYNKHLNKLREGNVGLVVKYKVLNIEPSKFRCSRQIDKACYNKTSDNTAYDEKKYNNTYIYPTITYNILSDSEFDESCFEDVRVVNKIDTSHNNHSINKSLGERATNEGLHFKVERLANRGAPKPSRSAPYSQPDTRSNESVAELYEDDSCDF